MMRDRILKLSAIRREFHRVRENAHAFGLSRWFARSDPLIIPQCASNINIIAIIEDLDEIRHIRGT